MSSKSNRSQGSIVPEEDQESNESSPKKDILLSSFSIAENNRLETISFGPNFENMDLFKQNNWKKNVEGLLSLESNVNASIVQGPEKYGYLEEVKLERLDKLNRHLSQSRTPST